MRADRHDDLVSTAAIVAGTAVSVIVTVMSFLLSGDDAAESPPVEIGPPSAVEEPAPVILLKDQDVVKRAIIIRPHDPLADAPETPSSPATPPSPGR